MDAMIRAVSAHVVITVVVVLAAAVGIVETFPICSSVVLPLLAGSDFGR